MMMREISMRLSLIFSALVGLTLLGPVQKVEAQFDRTWLSGGSLHNWYSAVGNEGEELGFVRSQQDGLRWPGIYRFRDAQAWKGLWIGARNVVDAGGANYPIRVVHAGPRVTGAGEFYPTRFELVSRFPLPEVYVDGQLSEPEAQMIVNTVDPDMIADQMIINEVNTLLGLTMERRIMQFSQGFHDNYHVIEYTFTNTGNADDSPEIELNQTLEDVVIYLQWRWSVAKESRYVIGNGTGWGMNTMLDYTGDGRGPDYGQDYKSVFAWHGRFPDFNAYDNIGGPILPAALPAAQIAVDDTLGRLGASQFVGATALHADVSTTDSSHDPGQPFVLNWIESDAPLNSGNDAFRVERMTREYEEFMTNNPSTRHAYAVEPSGDPGFKSPTNDPARGTSGGFSGGMGFGPYDIAPGESVRFVIVEAVAGLSREENERVGELYKAGALTDLEKNEIVFQSRDSLFQTFQRAHANFDSDYAIPRPPAPPTSFLVNSGGDRISLEWDYGSDDISGFEIYRARTQYDSTYTLVHTAGPSERSFDDTTPLRGTQYYYYIQAVGHPSDNTGEGLTPAGVALRSSRYYTQTYVGARLLRPAGPSPSRAAYYFDDHLIADSTFIDYDNVLEIEYANSSGGGAPGFNVTEASLELIRCGVRTAAEGCTRQDTLVIAGDPLPLDLRDTNVGASGTISFNVPNPIETQRATLRVGIVGLNSTNEATLRFNGVDLEVKESLVGVQDPMDAIRVVPNPYNISSGTEVSWDVRDQLGFLNVPGQSRIDIYTETGELIRSLDHRDGSGDEYWDLTTTSRQFVASGVYIAVITDLETNHRAYRKFVVIR